MDLANAIFTFVPAAAITSSIIVRLVRHYTESHARRPRTVPRPPQRARRALPTRVMFRSGGGPPQKSAISREQRSHAAERPTERTGTGVGNTVPALAEQLGTLADDALLRELALVVNADGSFKYADSRIAKFIGGRVEDRIAQVRAVRGTPAPPKQIATKDYPNRTEAQALLRQQLRIGK